jgi:hypothetical protein
MRCLLLNIILYDKVLADTQHACTLCLPIRPPQIQDISLSQLKIFMRSNVIACPVKFRRKNSLAQN